MDRSRDKGHFCNDFYGAGMLSRHNNIVIQCTFCKCDIDRTVKDSYVAVIGEFYLGGKIQMQIIRDLCSECIEALKEFGFINV